MLYYGENKHPINPADPTPISLCGFQYQADAITISTMRNSVNKSITVRRR
jgi:hypothetical protein